ncbi:hypothetical protein [Halogeometricum borinquense]|nr:hypothetical protein [Halogeometricum borinquense]
MKDTILRMGVVLLTAMLVLTAFSGGAAAYADDASDNTNIAYNGAYVEQNSGNAYGGGFSAFNSNHAGVTQVAIGLQQNTDNI